MEFLNDPLRVACLVSAASFAWCFGRILAGVFDSSVARLYSKVAEWNWRRKNLADAKLHDEYQEFQKEQSRENTRKAIAGSPAAPVTHGGYH